MKAVAEVSFIHFALYTLPILDINFMKIHFLDEAGDVNLAQNAKNAKIEKPVIDEKGGSSTRQVHKLQYNDPSLCLFDVFLEMQQ